jgi:pimeloyl-ACP methyl ester carboxylesterase
MLAGGLHDVSRDVHRIASPTLVLTGDADRLLPMGNSVLLAERIPGARLEVLPGAGHDFPTERPDEVSRRIADFFGLPPAVG